MLRLFYYSVRKVSNLLKVGNLTLTELFFTSKQNQLFVLMKNTNTGIKKSELKFKKPAR